MNFIFILFINLLALFLAPTIGTILSVPLSIIIISLTNQFKNKYEFLIVLAFLIVGLLIGGLTILGTFYFLKLFGLSLSWLLIIFIAFGFFYNDWNRYIKPLIRIHDREELPAQLANEAGTFISIFAMSFYLI